MDPLTQDQVEALERAAQDTDRHMESAALARQRRDVADWSVWECIAVQGVPLRTTARMVNLSRKRTRSAMARVSRELAAAEEDYVRAREANPPELLWPPN